MKFNVNKALTVLIALIWLANGLFCKVFNLVPRHEQIAARILDLQDGRMIIVLIGIAETVMAIWIFSRYKSKRNTITQMFVIALMNVLEFVFAPDLLLWGKFNSLFALMLILVIYYNEFVLNRKAES